MSTAEPGPLLLIYDGRCRFCIAGTRRLLALARRNAIHLVDLHDRDELARHPHAPQDPDDSTIRLVTPDGRVATGAEAIARALATRPAWRPIAMLYYIPGLRQALEALYRFIARHRYKVMGRTDPCDSGACRLPSR